MEKADQDLDLLYEQDLSMQALRSCWAAVARRRSAAALLRELLPADDAAGLDSATKRLDETIRGLIEEGFELPCRFARHGMPYKHWWLFLGEGGGVGKYGMCG